MTTVAAAPVAAVGAGSSGPDWKKYTAMRPRRAAPRARRPRLTPPDPTGRASAPARRAPRPRRARSAAAAADRAAPTASPRRARCPGTRAGGDADGHPGDRVEVADLAGGHPDAAVGDHPPARTGAAAPTGRAAAISAGTVSDERRDDTRASTAPAGDQPAPISDVPNVPDVPNAAADSSPITSPVPRPAPDVDWPGASAVRRLRGSTVSSVPPLPGSVVQCTHAAHSPLLAIRDV